MRHDITRNPKLYDNEARLRRSCFFWRFVCFLILFFFSCTLFGTLAGSLALRTNLVGGQGPADAPALFLRCGLGAPFCTDDDGGSATILVGEFLALSDADGAFELRPVVADVALSCLDSLLARRGGCDDDETSDWPSSSYIVWI